MRAVYSWYDIFFFFFFQAEDGIRDSSVTGVQTCALPIFDQFYNPAAFADPKPVTTIGQQDFSPLGGPRSQVTGPPLRQLDMGFARQLRIQQRQFEIRVEVFNITNTAAFNLPGSLNFNDPRNFASITTMRNAPRQVQIGAKVYW